MSNVEPYPYTSGGFDQGQRLAYGPPDAGDNADVTNPALQPTDAQQASSFPPYVIQSSVRLAQMARTRLGDVPAPFSCRVITDGAKWRFETPVEKIDNSTWQMVLTDGTTNTTTTPVLGTDYTVDFRSGTISFNQTPPAGQVLVCEGMAYKDFLPQEMQVYVRAAFLMHTNSYDPVPSLDTTWPLPTPPTYAPGVYGVPPSPQLPEIEEYPLSLLIAELCLTDVLTSISQDVDIRTPDGVTISRAQRFSQVSNMVQMLQAQYEKLCNLLQVGMYRIEIDTLRRVSRTTNRLVPVFRAQEYDDLSWRQRIMPPISKAQRTITDVGNYVPGQAYPPDVIVAQNGTRYISIQPVPTSGPAPATDVNPTTNNGFYWAVTNINAANWYGYWF